MSKVKMPNPIAEGWKGYRKLVDNAVGNTHMMRNEPHIKCLTHEDCHLDAFYPGKLYRAMEMETDEDGILRMKKD